MKKDMGRGWIQKQVNRARKYFDLGRMGSGKGLKNWRSIVRVSSTSINQSIIKTRI